MTDEEQQKLTVIMVELSSKIETLLDKQDELGDNISKIKEAVYNPDMGLYARLRDLDTRILQLETWKSAYTKVMWALGTSVMGLLAKTVWPVIF